MSEQQVLFKTHVNRVKVIAKKKEKTKSFQLSDNPTTSEHISKYGSPFQIIRQQMEQQPKPTHLHKVCDKM